jgi:hypothetical protein
MHLRISTKQLVDRILHVVALNAVGVQDTSARVGILRERRSGVALRDCRDPATRPGRAPDARAVARAALRLASRRRLGQSATR